MVKHFLKIAIRNLLKKGMLSALNIAGLSIGIAAFLVIVLYIFQETSYEKGFKDYDRIYRVETHFLSMDKVAWTQPNLQFRLNEIPGVEAYTRLAVDFGMEIMLGDESIRTNKTVWTYENFFDVFDYEIIAGDPSRPLTGPGKAVITKSIANKVFGRVDVIGEELKIRKNGTFLVSAVVEDPVIKSHLDFDLLLRKQNDEKYKENGWYNIGGYTYIKTALNTTQELLDDGLLGIAERSIFPNAFKPEEGMNFEDYLAHQNHISHYSKPITDVYLNSKLKFEIGSGGDRQTLVTLAIIATFILIIACINFMNLTTARSSGRTKEIGIRKVLGSRKKSLIFQFLAESLLITAISAIIGAALSEVLVVKINQSFGDIIGISLIKYPSLMINVGLGVLIIGLLAGLYPAFYLSSAKVIPLLKGMKLARVLNLNLAKGLRNGLVIVQFTLSTGLIISTFFVYNQLVYLKNKDLGFDKEQSLVITNANDLRKNKAAFRNEILSIPGVESASFTQHVPGDNFNGVHSIMLDGDRSVVMSTFNTDLDFMSTLGLELEDGEWFSQELVKTDSNVVINEAALQVIGLEEPVGKIFGNYYRIVGVMKDFNFGSLRESVGPAMFAYGAEKGNRLVVRVDLNRLPVEDMTAVWSRFTEEPISYHWLERNFEELLVQEEQMANAVTLFTILAVIISCIGLFGLAAFTADQRLQEFGIRKVLGASILDIIKVFSVDFLKLVGLAFLISVPLTFFGVDAWLQGYADRISITAGAFILAGVLAIVIAFVTILFQSIKTGRLNPVDTIKSE